MCVSSFRQTLVAALLPCVATRCDWSLRCVARRYVKNCFATSNLKLTYVLSIINYQADHDFS